jgi:hypothetical protein
MLSKSQEEKEGGGGVQAYDPRLRWNPGTDGAVPIVSIQAAFHPTLARKAAHFTYIIVNFTGTCREVCSISFRPTLAAKSPEVCDLER